MGSSFLIYKLKRQGQISVSQSLTHKSLLQQYIIFGPLRNLKTNSVTVWHVIINFKQNILILDQYTNYSLILFMHEKKLSTFYPLVAVQGFPDGSAGKESACSAQDTGDVRSIPGLERSPWKRKWHCAPVSLPGKFYGQRSLVGYSPWVYKQLDMTEHVAVTV